MGKSKEFFTEVREQCVLAMQREDYEAHEELLKPISRMIGAFLTGENHKGDDRHAELKEAYDTAKGELREYEMQKRYDINNQK